MASCSAPWHRWHASRASRGWRSIWMSVETQPWLVHTQDLNLRTAAKASYPTWLWKTLREDFIHDSLDTWEHESSTQGDFREEQGLGLSTGRRHYEFSTTDSWWRLNRLQTPLQQKHGFFPPHFSRWAETGYWPKGWWGRPCVPFHFQRLQEKAGDRLPWCVGEVWLPE